MNKILITGVAGLLGSRLADWLVENTEHEVIGIDDLSGGYIDNVPGTLVLSPNNPSYPGPDTTYTEIDNASLVSTIVFLIIFSQVRNSGLLLNNSSNLVSL
mgnify:CR=1 FL=1